MNERHNTVVARERGSDGPRMQRLELKYCERCGALGVQQAGASAPGAHPGNSSCGACRTSLQWLAGEVQR